MCRSGRFRGIRPVRPVRAGGGAALLLLIAACSGQSALPSTSPAASTRSAPPSQPGTSVAFKTSIAATVASIARLQDDLDINGNLTVPQNRYNLDVQKLATAVRIAQPVILDLL